MLFQASKAAVVSFFETLRVDFGSSIGITLVTPGLIESEMTKGKLLNKHGKLIVDQELRDVSFVDAQTKIIVRELIHANGYM